MKFESIYLVDDDDISNFNNMHLIEKMNVTDKIIVKKSGREILSELTSEEVNDNALILLDLMMPVIDGFEFLKKFEKLKISNKENIKIAVLTQYDSDFNSAKIERMGHYPIISKPLTREKFDNALKSLA